MLTLSRSIVLLLFLLLSLSDSLSASAPPTSAPPTSDDIWTPPNIPTTGAIPFVFYYQQFLRANPFAIDSQPRTPEDRAENRRRHQRAAELYTAMAEIANTLAQSDDLLPAAPAGIEKRETERIRGSWNLYPNVPVNAADLRQESLYMRFRALSHETSLDPNKIGEMRDFVADLEVAGLEVAGLEAAALGGEPDLSKLFQSLKRTVCSRALSFAHRPLRNHLDNPDTAALPDEETIANRLSLAVQWFVPFVQKYPTEDNLKLVDSFLDTIALFRSCYPDSEQLPGLIEPFRSAFADIRSAAPRSADTQGQQVEPLIREYAALYEGILRRWELLGKPMPIWGADMSGNRFDERTLDGKVVLLDFWATWCGPCLAKLPHLRLLYQRYKDRGFEIVSYSVDADQERLLDYLARNPLPWITLSQNTTLQAGLPSLSSYYGAKSLPVVLLRDRSGKAVLLDARGEKLEEMLEALLEEVLE